MAEMFLANVQIDRQQNVKKCGQILEELTRQIQIVHKTGQNL
jgi:hypothetical protein